MKRNTQLVVLAALTALFLLIAYILVASADTQQDAQNGCLFVSEIAWAGTDASTSDEWYEVGNVCSIDIDTNGWILETVRLSDGRVTTSTMPVATIAAGHVALFERTDDETVSNVQAAGIHGAGGTGGSLVGVFANSDVESFAIRNADGSQYHEVAMNSNGTWPAGSSSPKASMQVRPDYTWYTSNQSTGALDADGAPILGTPGQVNIPNTPNPDTCGTLPSSWDWSLDVIVYKDLSSRGEITLAADLWGVDDSGNLIATEGSVLFAHFSTPNVNGQTGWLAIGTEWEDGTSNACIDALEMLRDGTESVLRGRPSGIADQSDLWPAYADWLNAVLSFQRSGVFGTYLPVVTTGE